jgi:hypothetical protein
MAGWQSGYAAACKAADLGSIPGLASIFYFEWFQRGLRVHVSLYIL